MTSIRDSARIAALEEEIKALKELYAALYAQVGSLIASQRKPEKAA
jgi:hypothetical protein